MPELLKLAARLRRRQSFTSEPRASASRAASAGIDREAVLHRGLEQSLVGFVDPLDGDDFDIGGDVMCPAKIEHLLGSADKRKIAVEAEQVDIGEERRRSGE